MARYADLKKGQAARCPFEFPLPDGTMAQVLLRGIFGENEDKVLVGARAFAIARGIPEPMDGDPLYERGLMLHTVLLGVLDKDSSAAEPVTFFSSIEEINDPKDGLDKDRLALLYEAQQAWQDSIAPRPKSMDALEFANQVVAHALAPEDAKELPFEQWRPVLRRSFVRTMARLVYSLQELKSSSGPGNQDAGTSGKSSANGLAESSATRGEG